MAKDRTCPGPSPTVLINIRRLFVTRKYGIIEFSEEFYRDARTYNYAKVVMMMYSASASYLNGNFASPIISKLESERVDEFSFDWRPLIYYR